MNLVIEHTDIGHDAHPQDPTAVLKITKKQKANYLDVAEKPTL